MVVSQVKNNVLDLSQSIEKPEHYFAAPIRNINFINYNGTHLTIYMNNDQQVSFKMSAFDAGCVIEDYIKGCRNA